MRNQHILLCEHCIEAIKSRGEIVYVGALIDADVDSSISCDWCNEECEELYDCHF